MKPINKKVFATIFISLLVIQFLIVLADVMLTKNDSSLISITNSIIEFFSLPISAINRNLPFYVREPLYVKAVYWLMNLLIQSAIIYVALRMFKRLRKKLR